MCRSQWPRRPRRRSAAVRLLRLWVRIQPGSWKFVCCECCVLSGRSLCDGLITCPGESYRLWCVVVCDLETSWMKRPWPTGGRRATDKKIIHFLICFFIHINLFYNSCLFIYFSLFTSILAPVSPASCTVQTPYWSTHVTADNATLPLLLLLLPPLSWSFLLTILLPGSLE